MGFLTPIFLAGLLAIAIPIAIHFIRRDNPDPVVFSSLRFFQQTTRKHFFFQKMQQWLLLALRALAVALLAFAFARPFFGSNLAALADIAPRSVVIAIDRSMSMQYADHDDAAFDAAKSVINNLTVADEATVILFSDEVETVVGPTDDIDQLLAAINQNDEAGFRATQLQPVLVLANEILKEAVNHEKTLYLISDFQRQALLQIDSDWQLDSGIQLETVDVGSRDTRNLAITGVKLPNQVRGAIDGDILVRLRSFGNSRIESVQMSLTIDDKLISNEEKTFGEQSEIVVPVQVKLDQSGSHLGRIDISGDDFEADNSFYFTLDVLPKINVVVVNGEASRNWYDDEGHWFSLAISSGEQSPFSVLPATSKTLSSDMLQNADIVVLLNSGDLSSEQASAIKTFVMDGGSILFAPGDRVRAQSFNAFFADIAAGTLINTGTLAANDYLVIADRESRHPILKSLSDDWTVRFDGHWEIKPHVDGQVLMRFDNASPALIERQVGVGRSLLFASTLDMEWNNLPLQSMYLPFVHEMLKHLASTHEKLPYYETGKAVALINRADSKESLDFKSEDDDNLRFNLETQSLVASRPGIVEQSLENDSGNIFYAINVPATESDFTAYPVNEIKERFTNPDTKPVMNATVRQTIAKQQLEKPQRIWWWILWVVVALLLAEAWVANRTYR